MKTKFTTLIALTSLLLSILSWSLITTAKSAPQFKVVELRVGEQVVTAKVANNQATRAHGLMYAKSANPGMLLVYDQPKEMHLWMRNTLIPLDVAFFDVNGKIIKITQMEALSEQIHSSGKPVIGALELPLHWYKQHKVSIGDMIDYKTAISSISK
ncbi:DUF192 domain-containing protein [Flocculibacter collagenilyticus]|uniref:DUF192 domain-containing protein n=1 Tax=Flocculibacter collagenilyticus TaxID=2744479 RepID=UPI0018F364A0|nr:DUF192 domain-containing protein [Flocculibacter collagenilyticus]